jgi:hypothetical protein
MVRVTWPRPADEPYRVTVETGSGETEAKATRSSEFDRFRSLASKLIKVPKTELDEKRQKS